ncbi:MAG: endonuclease/exonuclease/phosphatase family protein [Prevotellaceae bacterium]|jgi:endonuclease/exonuclease/phosphatase family metal-dependent hydrolase|nr:endonuclease/exonuclease/phosphatase family protein [Prevotellaceae bacterium]
MHYTHTIIKRCFYALSFLSALSPLCGQSRSDKDTLNFCVMSYNVENLFDCRHDTLKEDYDFLPDAVRHWSYSKYRKKLDHVARVIAAVGGWTPPALVALEEVENDSVLRDLTRRSALREAGYRYVMTQSPDRRGIDVALLYQRGVFKLIGAQSIPIPSTDGKQRFRPTRDMLHVSGMLLTRDTLDVFVCHFPSRAGGVKSTESYRQLAARQLSTVIDSLFRCRLHPQFLVMGDFNGDCHLFRHPRLHHLLGDRTEFRKHRFGSYRYQGEWELIDHIIVSDALLQPDAPLHADDRAADVFRAPFLLRDDKKYGGKQPFRTYNGMRYEGGYSDHLPVWARLRVVY